MKPTADWELVLRRAKDAELRADRMEDEARRLGRELIDLREWTHAIAARAIARTFIANRKMTTETVSELHGLLQREEDMQGVLQANCKHDWKPDGGRVVKLTCTQCDIVLDLGEGELAEFARIAISIMSAPQRVWPTVEIVGEAPGAMEQADERPMVGPAPEQAAVPEIGLRSCDRCGDALPETAITATRFCNRCHDRSGRGVIVTPSVTSGVYIDVSGRKVFHPDGLKLVSDGTLRVEWFGKRIGHVVIYQHVWLPRWYSDDGTTVTSVVEAHTNLEAACRVVSEKNCLNLTSSSLCIGSNAYFAGVEQLAAVGERADSCWSFLLREGNVLRHEGYLTRDDACIAAFSLYTELNQTRQALGL